MNAKSEVTTGLVRYMRELTMNQVNADEITLAPHNMGGITFALNIHHAEKKLDVAYAICRPDENFSKDLGRTHALAQLEQGAVITIDYEPKAPLLNNMIHGVLNYQPAEASEAELTKLRTAKQTLMSIINNTEDAIKQFQELEFMSMLQNAGQHQHGHCGDEPEGSCCGSCQHD